MSAVPSQDVAHMCAHTTTKPDLYLELETSNVVLESSSEYDFVRDTKPSLKMKV